MTIPLAEERGTEMRCIKLLFAALALLLLLCGCSGGARFERDGDGFGYTDAKTGVHYVALPSQYEAGRAGDAVGAYTDRKFDVTTTFYAIPDLDSSLYLTDDNAYVYTAADPLPDAKTWQISAVLVCDSDAVSVESFRLTDAASITAVRALWFEGEAVELPLVKASASRRLKLASVEHPNLYYCFNFYAYEDGTGYFYDAEAGRAVACSAELVVAIKGT